MASLFASERTAPATAAPASVEEASQLPPGFVSVAFAEEKWAEREATFAQQLAQLKALVSPGFDSSSPAEPTASEADVAEAVEQPDEDEAWNTIERGKRKALLRQQRDILAKKVRANLGKVSAHASPFKKGQ